MQRATGWFKIESSSAAMFALASLFMLQSSRAFVSYLVFVVDQSQRVNIAVTALTVFTFPILTWLLVRIATKEQILVSSAVLMAIARLATQFIEEPVTRIILSGFVIIAWGVIAVLFATVQPRSVGIGLILGFGLDLGYRTARGSLDLLWTPGLAENVVILATIASFAALSWQVRKLPESCGSSWRLAGPLLVIGPAVALFHLVTGNVAFVGTHADASRSESSALLATAMVIGVVIAILRLVAIGLGGGGGAIISRFILFDALIGGVALGFAWSGEDLALLGIFFVTVTATELVIFALSSSNFGTVPLIAPASTYVVLGLLIQFAVLFIYYTATGSGVMLAIAWLGIVIGTVTAALTLSDSLQGSPFVPKTYAAPACLVGLVLVGSVVWSFASETTPAAGSDAADSLEVITYNIQSGFSRDNYWDLEATAKVIENSGADIVFLQELSRGWLVTTGNDELTWLSQRLDMPYAWGPASSDDLWGNAILSRYPMVSEKVEKYASTENLRRSALIVELDIGGAEPLIAISTHLDNPEGANAARSGQVEQLIALLEPNGTTILAGDFNMTPDDPLILEVLDAGLVDAAVAGEATQGTSEDGRRIDYIFVSPDIEVESAAVIDSPASDHLPVTATLIVR